MDDDPRSVDRRAFTLEAVLAILSGVTVTITGCGGDGGSDSPTAVASPTPLPTPEPTPEPAPEPTPEPAPEPTPEPAPAPTPDPTPTPSPTPTPLMDVTGSVSANHGHVAVITGAQLMSGGAVTLDIRGSADHPHTVQLTASDVAAIASNQSVSKQSSMEISHQHTVTFN